MDDDVESTGAGVKPFSTVTLLLWNNVPTLLFYLTLSYFVFLKSFPSSFFFLSLFISVFISQVEFDWSRVESSGAKTTTTTTTRRMTKSRV